MACSLSLSLIFLLILNSGAFAENITITTYYPAPSGVYNEMQANRMAVGDTDGSGGLTSGDLPGADGQLYTARSVIFKPQNLLPAFNTKEGEVVYKSSDKQMYVYKGAADGWQAVGGGEYQYAFVDTTTGLPWDGKERSGWYTCIWDTYSVTKSVTYQHFVRMDNGVFQSRARFGAGTSPTNAVWWSDTGWRNGAVTLNYRSGRAIISVKSASIMVIEASLWCGTGTTVETNDLSR